jgi:pyrimidine-nucleoside phosphorylase
MDQPLGQAVGNALEVREAIATLHGSGPRDFREHCLTVAAYMLLLGEKAGALEGARLLAEGALSSGAAWEKFRQLVAAQGGDVRYVDDPDQLPKAAIVESIPAPRSGYLARVDARLVGEVAVILGAGREKKGDPIDHAVGIEVLHKVGDRLEQGDTLFRVHANRPEKLAEACQYLAGAAAWSESPVESPPHIYAVVGGE